MIEIPKWEHILQLVVAALIGFGAGLTIGWANGWDEAKRFFRPWG